MAAPTLWDTGQDILEYVLDIAGEKTDDTSEYLEQAKRYIQRAYWDVYSWAKWPWATKYPPGVFQTVANVTGTATVTKGSASVTLGATIATSMADRKLLIDNEGIPYRILSHTAGTDAVTLDVPYTENTGSALGFTIYQDEYQLVTGANGAIRPYNFWFRNRPTDKIDFISKQEIENLPWRNQSTTFIAKIAMITDDRVRIRPWTEEAKTIEYEYAERQSPLTFDGVVGTDTPAVPVDDRHVIGDIAASFLLRQKNLYDDSDYNLNLGLGKLDKMVDKMISKTRNRLWISPRNAIGRGT